MKYTVSFVNEDGFYVQTKDVAFGLKKNCICGKELMCWFDFDVESAEVLIRDELCKCGKETYFIAEKDRYEVEIKIVQDGQFNDKGFEIFDAGYEVEIEEEEIE